MSLHPTMKRRLHERLHPLIGDEEADALLDQLPDDPITKTWLHAELDTRFDRVVTKDHLDERLERVVTKEHLDERLDRFVTKEHLDERLDRALRPYVTKDYLDAKLEGQDHLRDGMEHRLMGELHKLRGEMHQALKQQIVWVYGAAGLFALIISVIERIWGG